VFQIRDAEAMIETYDHLLENFSDQTDRRSFAPVRRDLFHSKDSISSSFISATAYPFIGYQILRSLTVTPRTLARSKKVEV
jgi:hypothetical protein